MKRSPKYKHLHMDESVTVNLDRMGSNQREMLTRLESERVLNLARPNDIRIARSLESRNLCKVAETGTVTINNMDDTERWLYSQLFCNSGRMLIDSGGADGRAWQLARAAGIDNLRSRQYQDVEYHLYNGLDLEITVSVDTIQFLSDALDVSDDMMLLLDEFINEDVERSELEGVYQMEDLEIQERFPEWLQERYGLEITGLYGDGEAFRGYTYNDDNVITHQVHYVYMTVDGEIPSKDMYFANEPFIVVCLHTGADARWGFSFPVVYQEKNELSFFDYTGSCAASLCTEDGRYRWWYDEGTWRSNEHEGKSLLEIPCFEFDEWPNIPDESTYDPNTTDMFGYNQPEQVPPQFPCVDTERLYLYDGDLYYGGSKIIW